MRHWIEAHLSTVFFAAGVLGLFLPGADRVPPETLLVVLVVVTFLSCFRLRWDEMRALAWEHALLFTIVRFAVLPLLMWALAAGIAPAYATSVLLIALIPAGVSSPALSAVFGGSVALSMVITLLSMLGSIATIPLAFAYLGDAHIAPPAGKMLLTLLVGLLLPMAAYWPLRRHAALSRFSEAHGRFFSILMIGLIILLVVARQRALILAAPGALAAPLVLVVACYGAFIAVGWCFFRARPQERIAALTCSVYNNAALGVSLAILHFPPSTVLATVVAEFFWSLLPLATRPLTRRIG